MPKPSSSAGYAAPPQPLAQSSAARCGDEDPGLDDSDGEPDEGQKKTVEVAEVQLITSLDKESECSDISGIQFDVDKRYKIHKAISRGGYAFVCSALDNETGKAVAVKKTEGVFEHLTIAKRTLRELLLLRHLQHENISKIRSIFTPQSRARFDDIYVISELMDTDLATTLQLQAQSNKFLSEEHIQFFLYQILRGMKFVHSAHVIHRDLKPRNLLVNRNCDLKICDFGLARICFQDKSWVCPLTEYVCTRWYRAPEVLCSFTEYTAAIDIWSIGCILAEMLRNKALFGGKSTQHMLDLITHVLGHPTEEELALIPNDKCRKFLKSLPRTEQNEKRMIFDGLEQPAQDFLDKCLGWDPANRMTIEEAISDFYVEKLHCAEDEPTREALDCQEFEFERRKIGTQACREEIFYEMLRYYPEKFEQENKNAPTRCMAQYQLLVLNESHYSSDSDTDTSSESK